MRTNIEISDDLMGEALELTGLRTKKAVVELGLKTLIRLGKQKEIRKFRRQLEWLDDPKQIGPY